MDPGRRRVVGAGTMLWYAVVIALGATTGSASDIYEPIAVAWSLAAIAGLFALSVRWRERRPTPPAAPHRADGPQRGRGSRGVVGGRAVGVRSRSAESTSTSSAGHLARPMSGSRLRPPSITFLAGLTGGFYLCHVLFINMVRAALYSNFVGGAHLPWPIRSAIFYVGTAVVAATFVA